jgi:FixJ family two-component response regulator
MNRPDHCVYVVDDDASMREAVDDLLSSSGFYVMSFGSAADYMSAPKPTVPACLILDVNLPDVNGLDLQRQLAGSQHPPIVFITGYGDISTSVRAMKRGAVDFLPKPFSKESILAAVDFGLERDRETRKDAQEREQLRERYDSLTPRERDVLPLIVSGLLNKQAAAELGISVVTLQIHRGNLMRKMDTRSLAELVRMATRLGIPIVDRRAERSHYSQAVERDGAPGSPRLVCG